MIVIRLGDIIKDIIGGGTPSKAIPSHFAGDIPFATVKDFKTRRPDNTIDHITEEALKYSSAIRIPADTLLITTRMSVGKIARFNRPVAINQDIKAIIPSRAVDKDYLEYFLIHAETELTALGTGTTVKGIRLDDIRNLQFPLPPLNEQRRIVAKLDSLLAKSQRAREELAKIPGLIQRYKQAVLAASFRGDLTREWRLSSSNQGTSEAWRQSRVAVARASASNRNKGRDERAAFLNRDEELEAVLCERAANSSLPISWCWAGLGEVFGIYVGATPSRKEPGYWDGTIPWVSSGEVAFCRINKTTEKISDIGLKNASTRLHSTGTVMLGMIGEGKTRGQAAILDIDACNNQNCAAIRVSEAGYSSEYVYWYLYSEYERTRTAGAGNNQPALNKNAVQRLPVPLAPPEESFVIAQEIEKRLQVALVIESSLAGWDALGTRLDQAILAKAFRGELAPQDPNDEPASALLERLRAETGERKMKRRGRNAKS